MNAPLLAQWQRLIFPPEGTPIRAGEQLKTGNSYPNVQGVPDWQAHQGGKRKRRKGQRRNKVEYLKYLLDVMKPWWKHMDQSALLAKHGVDLSRPVQPRGAVSKAITQLWEMRKHGWVQVGIQPFNDTRGVEHPPPVASSSAPTATEAP